MILGDEEEWKNVEMLDDERVEWDEDEYNLPDKDDEVWGV